ncbi:MAG: signal peptidase I [Candidatus Bipolaricaulota bacterium]|nr:MAG: signal peptidase I [Candidatus Bipolaricaulota bacterium]
MFRRRRRRERRPALIVRLVRRWGWNPGRVASEVLEWVEVLVVAGALAALVMTFVTVRMHVPTGSMIPTIDPRDSFFVDRISYYFRDPKPGDIVVFYHTDALAVRSVVPGSPADVAGITPGTRIKFINQIPVADGGEGIVATLPEETHVYLIALQKTDGGQYAHRTFSLGPTTPAMDSLGPFGLTTSEKRLRYVKRLIAVGGQTVQIRGGGVYVDGERLEGPRFDREYTVSNDARMRYGVVPTLVPEGKWFVLGDNSSDSLDSRYWGFADERDFIGEPYLRVWPLSRFGAMNGYFGSAP